MNQSVQAAPSKDCGSCSLCCKLPAIRELKKPRDRWCPHARPGQGCGIYHERPGICREFHCEWLVNDGLGPEWMPSTCKFLMFGGLDGNLSLLVDPGFPDAWRNPRYYPWLKTNAAILLDKNKLLLVHAGPEMIVMLPDRDERLRLPDGHIIHVAKNPSSTGMQYVVKTRPAGVVTA
jgi:hypothetical protein